MATIICPKCGTENHANVMNCENCRVNLKFALERLDEMEFAQEHPDMFEHTEQEAVQGTPEKAMSRKQARKKKGLTYLLIAVGVFILYIAIANASPTSAAEATTYGAIGSCFAVGTLLLLIAGLIYLVAGLVGK